MESFSSRNTMLTLSVSTDFLLPPNMAQPASGVNISKRRKFVADGVFYAELNEFFQRELAEEGYSGVEVRVTPTVTDIIIRATHTQEVLGEQGRRIREVRAMCAFGPSRMQQGLT